MSPLTQLVSANQSADTESVERSRPSGAHAGFSLVEVLVALGVLGGMSLIVLSIGNLQNNTLQGSQAVATRDQLKTLLDRYLTSRTLLKNSLEYTGNAGNRELNYCINGVQGEENFPECPTPHEAGQACCPHVASGSKSFVVLDPSDPAKSRILSGTEDAPARFDIHGAPCASKSAQCSLEVVSRFVSTCADPTQEKCATASRVIVKYEVRQADGTQVAGRAPLKKVGGEVALSMKEMRAPASSGGSGSGTGGSVPSDVAAVSERFRRELFNQSAGPFPVPAGVTEVLVTLVGGGGGGGGGSGGSNNADYAINGNLSDGRPRSGAGGASGCAYQKFLVQVEPGESFSVSIGGGGAGGVGGFGSISNYYPGTTGAKGGDTAFSLNTGFKLIAPGGGGGEAGHKKNHLPKEVEPKGGIAPCVPPLAGGRLLSTGTSLGNNGGYPQGGAAPMPNVLGASYTQPFAQGGNGGWRGDNARIEYRCGSYDWLGNCYYTYPAYVPGGRGEQGAPGNAGVAIVEYLLPAAEGGS